MSETIADELRGRMGRGELVEGDFLPNERVLTEEFAVSRPTLREALRILEAEGLIEAARWGAKGARIKAPSADIIARNAGLILQVRGASVADIFRVYTLITPAAARTLAERPDRDVGELRWLLSEMSRLTDNPDGYAWMREKFDRALIAMSGNTALNLVAQMMGHILRLHLNTMAEPSYGSTDDDLGLARHGPNPLNRVVDAIEAGNGALAEQLMQALASKNEGWHRSNNVERLSVVA
jgi:DNA-binding FadR family transcriptional regulator